MSETRPEEGASSEKENKQKDKSEKIDDLQNQFNKLHDDIENFNKDKERVISGEDGKDEILGFQGSFRRIMDKLKDTVKDEANAAQIVKDKFPIDKVSNICIQLGNPLSLGAAKHTYDKLTDQSVDTEIKNTKDVDKKIFDARLHQIDYYDYNKSTGNKYDFSFNQRHKMYFTFASIIHDDKLVQHLQANDANRINTRMLGYENYKMKGLMQTYEKKRSANEQKPSPSEPETVQIPKSNIEQKPQLQVSPPETKASRIEISQSSLQHQNQEKRTPIIRDDDGYKKVFAAINQRGGGVTILKLKEDVNTQKEEFFKFHEEKQEDLKSLLIKMRTLLNLISFTAQLNPDKETNESTYAHMLLSRDDAANMLTILFDKMLTDEKKHTKDESQHEEHFANLAPQITDEIGKVIDKYNELMKDDIFVKVVEHKKELLNEMNPPEPLSDIKQKK